MTVKTTDLLQHILKTQIAGNRDNPSERFYAKIQSHVIQTDILIIGAGSAGEKVAHRAIETPQPQHDPQNVGVIKHKDGLLNAQSTFDEIETTQIKNLFLRRDHTFKKIAELFEVQNMFTFGQLMVHAALLRTESRGAHQRQDFPELDPSWEKHILFRLSIVGPEVRTVQAT